MTFPTIDHSQESFASLSHASAADNATGFVLSLVLTLASFGVVMSNVVPHETRLGIVVALCVLQLVVQLVYFLHMGTSRDKWGNTAIFLCTGLLIAIVVGGSLWVMHNANVNMMAMPMTVQQAILHP